MKFIGKVAVVTGGTKGIGLAAAMKFASEGAAVAIIGSHKEDSSAAVNEIRKETNNENIIGLDVDVANSDQVKIAIEKIVNVFEGVDILVNSAGIQRYGTVVDTEEATWDEVIDTNLKGMFLTSKYIIPEMKKRGGGAIVNLSSVQAYASQTQVAAYTASKGAINALTRAMALDHARENIRVNVVCPASVDTPMLRWAADLFKGEQTQEDVLQDWGKMHPIGRVGKPSEIAELIAYLCSDQAGFMTGGDYKVDGGLLSALGVGLPD